MNLEKARLLAEEISVLLRPSCERLEVAGGIRREKPDPHDIEIVAVPKFAELQNPELLVPSVVNYLDMKMVGLIATRVIQFGAPVVHRRNAFRPDAGTFTTKAPFSARYYRVLFKYENVDLFVVIPPAQWGPIMTLRTGDRGFSHWLVQQGYAKGIYFDEGHLVQHVDTKGRYIAHVAGFTMSRHDCTPGKCARDLFDAPAEEDVFRILGVSYRPPQERVTAPTETTVEEWEESSA